MAAEASHEPCHCIQGRIQWVDAARARPMVGAGPLAETRQLAELERPCAGPGELDRLYAALVSVTAETHPRTAKLLGSGRRRAAQKVIEEAARSRSRPSSVVQPVSCARVLICSTTSSCSGAAPTSIPLTSMRRCSAAQTPWVSPKSCRRRPPASPRTVGRYRGRLPGNDRRRMVRRQPSWRTHTRMPHGA
jgi:hypothetical protein